MIVTGRRQAAATAQLGRRVKGAIGRSTTQATYVVGDVAEPAIATMATTGVVPVATASVAPRSSSARSFLLGIAAAVEVDGGGAVDGQIAMDDDFERTNVGWIGESSAAKHLHIMRELLGSEERRETPHRIAVVDHECLLIRGDIVREDGACSARVTTGSAKRSHASRKVVATAQCDASATATTTLHRSFATIGGDGSRPGHRTGADPDAAPRATTTI